jgi:hypothetical protein
MARKPLWANMWLGKFVSQISILRITCWETDKLIIGIKHRNHYTISAINYGPNTHACPLSNILKCNSIAIVAYPIQKDGKLDGDRELRIVGLILKDRVIRYMIEDVIKDLRVDTEFLPKQVRAVFLMVNQHMKLRCLWRGLVRLVQYMRPLNLITKSLNGVLKTVVKQSDIVRRDRTIIKIWSSCHGGEGGKGGGVLEDRLIVSLSEVIESESSKSE